MNIEIGDGNTWPLVFAQSRTGGYGGPSNGKITRAFNSAAAARPIRLLQRSNESGRESEYSGETLKQRQKVDPAFPTSTVSGNAPSMTRSCGSSRFSTTDISVIVDLPDIRPAACRCGDSRFQEQISIDIMMNVVVFTADVNCY